MPRPLRTNSSSPKVFAQAAELFADAGLCHAKRFGSRGNAAIGKDGVKHHQFLQPNVKSIFFRHSVYAVSAIVE